MEKKVFCRQTHGSWSAKPQSQKNLCPNKFRHMWMVMKLTYAQVLAPGLKNKPGRSTQGEGGLANKWKCYWSILYLFLQCRGSAASMSLLINKTGQGSFSDPQGNRHSTDWVHMAKLSPFHPPTWYGFILTAQWKEPCWLPNHVWMRLCSRGQSQGKEHRNN